MISLRVVYLEDLTSAAYVDKSAPLQTSRLVFDRLRAAALGPDDTAVLIKQTGVIKQKGASRMITPELSLANWRKSSRSSGNGGDCVEVAHLRGAVGVRDSKNPTGLALVFTAHHWAAFHTGFENGRVDLA